MEIKTNLTLAALTRTNLPYKKTNEAIPVGKNVSQNREPQNLKEATRMFEEFFVHSLLREMRKNIPQNSLMGGGHGEEIFRDMLDGQYSRLISQEKGIGLAQFMYEQLSKK